MFSYHPSGLTIYSDLTEATIRTAYTGDGRYRWATGRPDLIEAQSFENLTGVRDWVRILVGVKGFPVVKEGRVLLK